MLIALFTLLFLGGSRSPFIVSNPDKLVKTYVQDDTRKSSALHLIAAYQEHANTQQKQRKNMAESVHDLVKDYNADVNDIEAIMQQYRDQRSDLNNNLVTSRLEIQKVIKPSEWAEMKKAILADYEKHANKNKKKYEKRVSKVKKKLNKAHKKIANVFSTPEEQEKVNAIFKPFKNTVHKLLDQNWTYQEKTVSTLTASTINQKSLAALVYEMEAYRNQTQTALTILYTDLKKITPKEKWPKVAKQLNKLI